MGPDVPQTELRLLVEQVRVCSGPRRGKYQLTLVYCRYQQPIRADATFTETNVVSRKRMVAMTFFERLFCAKLIEYRLELTHIQSALFALL